MEAAAVRLIQLWHESRLLWIAKGLLDCRGSGGGREAGRLGQAPGAGQLPLRGGQRRRLLVPDLMRAF
jgi:hypothetical protein